MIKIESTLYGRLCENQVGTKTAIQVMSVHGHYECKRCGNTNQQFFSKHKCTRCNKVCAYCRQCVAFGKIRECSELYVQPPPQCPQIVSLGYALTLSPAQEKISAELIASNSKSQRHLVWSVAGSGKTEMTFALIMKALGEGKNVCWAIPRRDIVIEIYERFLKAFLGVKIIALYGGSPMNKQFAPLIVATTHQLLQFYQTFDLLIIDEHDAFPYKGTDFLHVAGKQSVTPNGSIVLLSATPSSKERKKLTREGYATHILPARYHRYALPEVKFSVCSTDGKKLPRVFLSWLQKQLDLERPILVFASTIKVAVQLCSQLTQYFLFCDSVHSQDDARNEKIAAFRDGETKILVTTTILERGITISNVAVAVYGAESTIFDEAALVQIAGRVGRKLPFATGEVVLFAKGISYQMLRARAHIRKMNERAKHQGLIEV